MRKKFLTMFLVCAMALSITACGGKETEEASNTPSQPTVEQNVEENVANDNQQETVVENEEVVENTDEEVLEGDAPIEEGDGEINDDANRGVETIDLTNTTIYNVAEKFNATIELPVFTFAYFEDTTYYGYYKAYNVDGSNVYEVYSFKVGAKKKGVSAAEAYTYITEQYNEMNSSGNYLSVEMAGTESSSHIVVAGINNTTVNGSSLEIIDVYYIYDPATQNVYGLDVAISKDSELFGEDIMEKSAASYREELRSAVMALAN